MKITYQCSPSMGISYKLAL